MIFYYLSWTLLYTHYSIVKYLRRHCKVKSIVKYLRRQILMAFSFCIQRTNMDVDEQFIRLLFINAFDDDLISHIVQVIHSDGILYKSFIVYFTHNTFRINLFLQDIIHFGFAYFSFTEVYNQYISAMEYIVYTSPNHSMHNSSKTITWSITL